MNALAAVVCAREPRIGSHQANILASPFFSNSRPHLAVLQCVVRNVCHEFLGRERHCLDAGKRCSEMDVAVSGGSKVVVVEAAAVFKGQVLGLDIEGVQQKVLAERWAASLAAPRCCDGTRCRGRGR